MKASRFSDAQKAFILKQGANGMPVANQSCPLISYADPNTENPGAVAGHRGSLCSRSSRILATRDGCEAKPEAAISATMRLRISRTVTFLLWREGVQMRRGNNA